MNSFAMSTICKAIVMGMPVAQPYAARALRSILRCSITACDWVLGNEDAIKIILDGVRHRDATVQEYCIWSIHDLSARNKGAAALVKRGGFVQLKVLLYTDVRGEAQVAAIRSLKHFLLGLDRVAGPDEELIRRLTELLLSDDKSLQDACADILARMIQQDYIDLFVHVHGAKNCPQSDNWGYCDPFVKMMINEQQLQTPILRNTLNPVWEYDGKFSISDKSDNLKVELFDWDNTGAEVLGEIELSCERLHELGTELGLYRVGRALTEKALILKNEAEQKATSLLDETRAKSEKMKQDGLAEAVETRDALLEEARFVGSDAKAEAKKILDDASAAANKIVAAAAGQGRLLEFRAEQQALKLKDEAKKKAKEVQKVWENTTKDIEDIPERIKQVKQQAKSKYDRIRKESTEQADKTLLKAMKEAMKIRNKSSEESERILSLKEGWHIVMEKERDELTGKELMGFKGEIAGFDDNGKVVGEGGKRLEPSPTVLKINFEYNINVNVDAIIYDHPWIIPRLFELLALEGRRQLRENILVVLRALAEDIKESRLVIGQFGGGLELLSSIFDMPGLDSCYVEICKLLALLIMEPDNRKAVYHSPLMNHLKSLRKWKGSDVAVIAAESISKLDKHADRVRRMEKEKKKTDRQIDAANRHKKQSPKGSPDGSSISGRSPGVSPQNTLESIASSNSLMEDSSSSRRSLMENSSSSRRRQHSCKTINTSSRDKQKKMGSQKVLDVATGSDTQQGPVVVYGPKNPQEEEEETDRYADLDYESPKVGDP